MKAANKAREVKAAEAMAKPLPVAAVVLPTASRISVRSRTSFGNSLISAIPPALSAIGPKASMANCMAVVAIIPAAAMATPYKPANFIRKYNTSRQHYNRQYRRFHTHG